jgi:uncharacterized membrane protein YgcG
MRSVLARAFAPTLRSVVCVAALALPAVVLAQMGAMGGRAGQNPTFKPGPGPDDLWEMTMKMEMTGMQMPGHTSQMCIKKGRKDADLVPASEECRTTDVRTSGNRTTFSMTCKGDPPMTGTGDITSTPTSMNGRMTMTSTKRGEEMTMVQTFSGKKIGTCTDTTEQYIAKVEADSKAMTAKACGEQMDALAPTLFDTGGVCAAQRKAFCDKTGGVAGTMREPAGHSAARQKYSGTLRPALQFCGQDYAAISKVACGKAVDTRNWNFIGSGPCDDDVRAQAPKFCNTGPNRSPDPQYYGLCSRYVALTRGTATADDGGSGSSGGGSSGGSAGTGAQGSGAGSTGAAAAPQQPDPIKQGVDAVRRLLPF